ncbi:nitric-oxide reductase large subunit [Methylohalobius crimeensis]|uniref:nitric-oxide reductase large subunit n=1 Tax=Methylohalobius crimeensis TaxID=244365 RepID=UPI0003B6F900|nr:cbb3-type cytochrome c oxidase subunit I [Methylohalobius crimeensis]
MTDAPSQPLSRAWRWTALGVLVFGFMVLTWMTRGSFVNAPPVPEEIRTEGGKKLFGGDDIRAGQALFLRYGLMENGTVWGHGAYLGPDFAAEYLHRLVLTLRDRLARLRHGRPFAELEAPAQAAIAAEVKLQLKENRYDAAREILRFNAAEAETYRSQVDYWREYFSSPAINGGLRKKHIDDDAELERLTAFFAWAAWASVANRPGEAYSYTNNFPYDPEAGNLPTASAVLWSALSLIALLGGTGLVLLAFGKFDYLGWKESGPPPELTLHPGEYTPAQLAVVKFFLVVTALFLAQTLLGGLVAHYRAEPGSFYGLDLSGFLPSNLARTWHLQLAVLWVAVAYIASGLFLASVVGGGDPEDQPQGVNRLFLALLAIAVASLLGEWIGILGGMGPLWFWLGNQGWEYLELGRLWQWLLAGGLLYWLWLIFRALRPALSDYIYREIGLLLFAAAAAIPVFYLPALLFGAETHFTVAETWRFWIIHLWVEGFFEFFITVLVAVLFHRLGVVGTATALRVIYLDAILYFIGGIIGTAHHWYWTGQSPAVMALGAVFSALEVIPLILLTLDAWDFVRLAGHGEISPERERVLKHRWTFYFLMAVGFWNFVGAGIFGFLINLPIVSYYEVGTLLTPNHGHAAFMGVFGMLALGLGVFVMRQVADDELWQKAEKWVRIGFWGVNLGLAGMLASNLFPNGVRQLLDVVEHGYWHARGLDFTADPTTRWIEWLRTPADLVFIVFGALPLLVAASRITAERLDPSTRQVLGQAAAYLKKRGKS